MTSTQVKILRMHSLCSTNTYLFYSCTNIGYSHEGVSIFNRLCMLAGGSKGCTAQTCDICMVPEKGTFGKFHSLYYDTLHGDK